MLVSTFVTVVDFEVEVEVEVGVGVGELVVMVVNEGTPQPPLAAETALG